jgi:hypothetical protein
MDNNLNDKKPVLDNWKTNIGAFIGGLLSITLVNNVPTLQEWWMFDLVIIVGLNIGLTTYYALGIYPSLFSAHPKLKSKGAISFLNGVCGYIVFGCIWNSNLTKRNKGISHIVWAVINIVIYLVVLLLFFYGYY